MMFNKNILELENHSYSFSDYFKMNIKTKDLAEYFGYDYNWKAINLERDERPHPLKIWIKAFLGSDDQLRRLVNLTNERAMRAFLISPIIFELVKGFNVRVDIDSSVYYSKTRHGNIDYILTKK